MRRIDFYLSERAGLDIMGNILQYMRDLYSGEAELALQGQVVLVTGASSGIGREIAIQMHSRAMRVILASRNTEKLQQLRNLDMKTDH